MAAEHANILPIWVWLLFTVLLVGVITYIYSEGKWRTTFIAASLTACVILAAWGIEVWIEYLKIHFIGRYDSLGIPFKEVGPGWSILFGAWPLWLIPMGLMALALFGIDWVIRRFYVKKNAIATSSPSILSESTPFIKTEPLQNISKKLEIEAHKQELAELHHKLADAVEIAETQLDKKQQLEASIEQLKIDHGKKISELESKIAAVVLEIEAYQTQKEELTALTIEQAEEILRLKNTKQR